MSEPVGDFFVDSLAQFLVASIDEACGDYLSHEQADKLREVIHANEVSHFEHEGCAICLGTK